VVVGTRDNEDAAIVRVPGGKAIVQTLDFFTPIVDDPYLFGQIAAANALSDVYAMGGEPWCALNIVCFPVKELPEEILADILRGGADKVREAGAVLVGGHSIEDESIKYGLSVTGIIDPDCYATNTGLRPGDVLLLTKPLGSGVLATAVKAGWDGFEAHEQELGRWGAMLNRAGGRVIRELGLAAATDVTGFGLGGHLLEMANASNMSVHVDVSTLPLMPAVLDLVATGLLPAGSHANRHFCSGNVSVHPEVDSLLVDIVFDAQTSGGLILAVPPHLVDDACSILRAEDAPFWRIGHVEEMGEGVPRLVLQP